MAAPILAAGALGVAVLPPALPLDGAVAALWRGPSPTEAATITPPAPDIPLVRDAGAAVAPIPLPGDAAADEAASLPESGDIAGDALVSASADGVARAADPGDIAGDAVVSAPALEFPDALALDTAPAPVAAPAPDGARASAEADGAAAALDARTALASLEAPPGDASVHGAAGAPSRLPDTLPLIAKVQSYSVAPGDTLASIARRFGIDVDTLRAANRLPDPDLLYVGQALTVLPVPGVLQVAAPGDTVAALAKRYGVPAAAIAAANGLDDAMGLPPGQPVLVPGGKPLAITSARGTAWPMAGTGAQRKAQFIAAAVAPAQASQRETGVPASVTIAQAILESNWGDSLLARDANNFFGIKATGAAASGTVYWMSAWEVVDGEDVESFEPFRAYTSPEASFADHGLFFRQNSRYWPALYLASDPAAFARAIAEAGYATDPAYGAKLVALMDAYQLYQYDIS